MNRSRNLIAALTLAVGLTACVGTSLLAPDAETTKDEALKSVLASGEAAAETRASPGTTTNAGGGSVFDQLARTVSSFGGLYRNGLCSVGVVVTDISQEKEANRAVHAAIEPLVVSSCPTGIRVQVVAGKYTYVQLQRILGASRPLFQIHGVSGVKVDYKLNKVVVTVASREVARAVLEALPRIGLPAEAVGFEVGSGASR